MSFHTETKPHLRSKAGNGTQKAKTKPNKFFSPFSGGKKKSKKLYLKIMALLKTPICELIRGSLKEKIPSSGKTWVVFIGMVTVHSHWTILSPSLGPKSGRWEATGQGSFRVQSPAMTLYKNGGEILFGITSIMALFWEMHKSDKERTPNSTKIYWLRNTKNIICKNPGYTFPPRQVQLTIGSNMGKQQSQKHPCYLLNSK